MGDLAKVWARMKPDLAAKDAVNLELQAQVAEAQAKLPDAADAAALEEMKALYPEPK